MEVTAEDLSEGYKYKLSIAILHGMCEHKPYEDSAGRWWLRASNAVHEVENFNKIKNNSYSFSSLEHMLDVYCEFYGLCNPGGNNGNNDGGH